MFKSLEILFKCVFTSKKNKIKFLQDKVYNYYYTILLNREMKSDVSIPYFLIVNQIKSEAMELAIRDLENTVKACKVNESYKAALVSAK